jgi:hypothetical protein
MTEVREELPAPDADAVKELPAPDTEEFAKANGWVREEADRRMRLVVSIVGLVLFLAGGV